MPPKIIHIINWLLYQLIIMQIILDYIQLAALDTDLVLLH